MSTPSNYPASLPSVVDAELLLSADSISLPSASDLSPGGPLHGPYTGLNIVQGYHKKRVSVRIQGKRPRHATTITMLSDNVLLDIFDSCQKNHDPGPRFSWLPEGVWDWHILVHVCQRWRQLVFASPLRLNLRILCTHGTPVRKNLNIWPAFPIRIEYLYHQTIGIDADSVIAALEHPDRVSAVSLFGVTGPKLGKIVTAMQEPFLALTHIFLTTDTSNDVPVLPSEFLGRSAPCLQNIELFGIPFPALPALLLSTNDLVTLRLFNIPQTGYIPPEAMVVGLATLIRLEDLLIGFLSPASRPDQIRLPPVTRTLLPALTFFEFRGVREYLEDFVARIYAPRLHKISLRCFNQLVDFEVPQLWQFIDHSEDLNRPSHCLVEFHDYSVSIAAGPTTDISESEFCDDYPRSINIDIVCEGVDWQVSHLTQLLNQISAGLSNVLHLFIGYKSISLEPEDMGDVEWLELLRPFSSVQTLSVSDAVAGHLSRALEDIPEMMATDVLPSLDMLCLRDQPVSSVHKFIAARSESGRPVTNVDIRAIEERLAIPYVMYL